MQGVGFGIKNFEVSFLNENGTPDTQAGSHPYQFVESNPAACPAASKIGYAVVHTPLTPALLQGPAIFVSHGGEAFPSLTLVLQGYGITIDLVGTTDIKNGGM